MGKLGFIYKSKGGIGSGNSGPLRRGFHKIWENTTEGVKTAADWLGRLTIAWKVN